MVAFIGGYIGISQPISFLFGHIEHSSQLVFRPQGIEVMLGTASLLRSPVDWLKNMPHHDRSVIWLLCG